MQSFDKLKKRLILVCLISTSLILIAMAAYSYYFSVRQLRKQSEKAFEGEYNSIIYTLTTYDLINSDWIYYTESNCDLIVSGFIDDAEMVAQQRNWLQQIQGQSNMIIDIEDAISQHQYTPDTVDRIFLSRLARSTALSDYGFDPYEQPASQLSLDKIVFVLKANDTSYRTFVSRMYIDGEAMSIVILKDMSDENREVWVLAFIYFAGIVISLICLYIFSRKFTLWAIKPVKESRERQTDFISSVSHELRSPLTVILANLEMIKDAPIEEATEFVEIATKECNRMARLTNDMLRLVRADGHSWELQMTETAPEEILLDTIAAYEPITEEQGISLIADIPEKLLPPGFLDKERIMQVMAILMDNAMRYVPEQGTIRISAKKEARSLIFCIADNGEGIPEEQRSRVFERFYRGDESRTDKEHYGLGLSIAMEIVHLHGGTLAVADSDLGGAEFIIKLPI